MAYDISWMGFVHAEHGRKNGIPRVIEELARALVVTGECDLHFVAPTWTYETARYIESDATWRAMGLHTTRQQDLQRASTRLYNQTENDGKRSLAVRVRVALLRRLAGVGRNSLVPRDVLRGADVYHTPFGDMPPITREFPGLARFHTIYDLIPILFPHTVVAGHREAFARTLTLIQPDDWVFVISEQTRKDLCAHVKIDPERVIVVYSAADKEVFRVCKDEAILSAIRQRYRIPEGNYLLSVSTLAPHKNLPHLIRVFASLVEDNRLAGMNLVLVGGRSWTNEEIEREFSAHPGLRERVIFTGFADDADLAAIYSGAIAFVFPSLYEGFGIPPLEAMQCGTPVISSNASSLPEVVGDAAVLVPPTDEQALYRAIDQVCSSSSLRADLQARGLARAAQFSWERAARETIAAYRQAVNLAGKA